jgi:hypothetical protein
VLHVVHGVPLDHVGAALLAVVSPQREQIADILTLVVGPRNDTMAKT